MLNSIQSQRLLRSLCILIFIGSATFLSAQVEQTAELKVTVHDIITFTLNDVNPTLVFDEADDFANGVTYTASNAGLVTASGTFSLSVEAKKKDLEDSAGNKINAESISLAASGSDLGTLSKIAINKSSQDLISGAPACITKTFDLTYSTASNDTEFIGKPAGDYTVELTFTATLD